METWSFFELSEAAWWALCLEDLEAIAEIRRRERACDRPCEEYFEYADQIDTNPRPWEPGEF